MKFDNSNSFLRFLLRCMVQTVYLMPRPAGFPEQPPAQPYIGGIIGTNLLCMGLHIYSSQPQAGEATRGYLHGGLLLDFIGQKGPTSKFHLVLLDFLILLLQLVALSALVERKDLEKMKRSHPLSTNTEHRNNEMDRSATQDHDAEERGELRRPSILLDALALEGGSGTFDEEIQDRRWSSQPRQFAVADIIASGQAMIAELWIADTVRQQHNAYQEYRRTSSTSSLRDRVSINLQQRRLELPLPFGS